MQVSNIWYNTLYYTVGLAIPDIFEKRPHEYVHVRVHFFNLTVVGRSLCKWLQ